LAVIVVVIVIVVVVLRRQRLRDLHNDTETFLMQTDTLYQ
jgi:hypothetical protein